MSRRQAEFVERMVHRKLASLRHKNELFRMGEAEAASEIEIVIGTLGFSAGPYVPIPPPPPKPRKKREKREGKPRGAGTLFTFRFERTLRERAERCAEADQRALGVWVHRLIAEKVATLDRSSSVVTSPTSHDPSAV